jgi:thymidylate kinase
LTFIVLEGFSGTGKTTLAKTFERRGWLRLAESAHAVSGEIPVGERADTFSDYSLVGATMQYASIIARSRRERDIVAEGYFLSDLAYAVIRYDLKKSAAFPHLLEMVRNVLGERILQPDLYLLLRAQSATIRRRQEEKNEREKNVSKFFRKRYYTAIEYIHEELGQRNLEIVNTDSDAERTLARIMVKLRSHGIDVSAT